MFHSRTSWGIVALKANEEVGQKPLERTNDGSVGGLWEDGDSSPQNNVLLVAGRSLGLPVEDIAGVPYIHYPAISGDWWRARGAFFFWRISFGLALSYPHGTQTPSPAKGLINLGTPHTYISVASPSVCQSPSPRLELYCRTQAQLIPLHSTFSFCISA